MAENNAKVNVIVIFKCKYAAAVAVIVMHWILGALDEILDT